MKSSASLGVSRRTSRTCSYNCPYATRVEGGDHTAIVNDGDDSERYHADHPHDAKNVRHSTAPLPWNCIFYSVASGLLNLQTVGNLLNAWRSPRNHRSIEQLFDSPQQARNAVAVCATWLGVQMKPQHNPSMGWWRSDDEAPARISA